MRQWLEQSVKMTISVVIEPSFRYLSIQDDVFNTVHLAFLEQTLPFRVRGESRERSSVYSLLTSKSFLGVRTIANMGNERANTENDQVCQKGL
jgi:hypothetical protein